MLPAAMAEPIKPASVAKWTHSQCRMFGSISTLSPALSNNVRTRSSRAVAAAVDLAEVDAVEQGRVENAVRPATAGHGEAPQVAAGEDVVDGGEVVPPVVEEQDVGLPGVDRQLVEDGRHVVVLETDQDQLVAVARSEPVDHLGRVAQVEFVRLRSPSIEQAEIERGPVAGRQAGADVVADVMTGLRQHVAVDRADHAGSVNEDLHEAAVPFEGGVATTR